MQDQNFGIKEVNLQRISNSRIENPLTNTKKSRKRTLVKGKNWHKQHKIQSVQSQQFNFIEKLPTVDLSNPFKKVSICRANTTQKSDTIKQYSQRASDMLLSIKIQMEKDEIQQKPIKIKLQNPKNKISKKLKQSFNINRKDALSLKIKHYQNSPYIGNKSNIDKLIKMLKPVNGPNQSIKKQILRHNDLNKKNHQLVLMRSFNHNFQIKRKKYLQRIGLKSHQKVFVMNSRDHHIRETLLQRGWIQLDDLSDGFFHLKWVYSDNSNDYQNLNRGQLFNHFYNNQELTNKNNLRKNIKNRPLQEQPRIPLTYDLGYTEQYNRFSQKAIQLECYKILHKIIQYFRTQQSYLYQKTIKNPYYFKFHNKTQSKNNILYLSYDLLFSKKVKDINNKTDFDRIQNRHSKENDQFIQNLLQLIEFLMKIVEKQTQINYAYLKLQKSQDKKQKNKKNMLAVVRYYQKIFLKFPDYSHYFKSISNFLKVQLIKLYKHFLTLNDFQGSYGSQNIWIVKPIGVSRGAGIYLQPDFQKLFYHNNNQHGKIVQKYIQRPFLLQDRRKFDLRQWVLVRKFIPLEVYVYRNLYGRICPQKYELSDFQNVQKHLTNFSISKQSYLNKKSSINGLSDSPLFTHVSLKKVQQKSVILEQDLKIYIQRLSRISKSKKQFDSTLNKNMQNITWKQIKLNIKREILKTLKACSSNIEPNQNCFEVYGFDILLDQSLTPYIIEVNLSPACQKRQGLQVYLQEMSHGLVDYIQEWIGEQQKQQYKQNKQKRLQKELIWQFLQEMEIQNELRQIKERKIRQNSASVIQRWFRNWQKSNKIKKIRKQQRQKLNSE